MVKKEVGCGKFKVEVDIRFHWQSKKGDSDDGGRVKWGMELRQCAVSLKERGNNPLGEPGSLDKFLDFKLAKRRMLLPCCFASCSSKVKSLVRTNLEVDSVSR